RDNADQVERVGAAQRDKRAARLLAPHRAEQPDRFGKRVLLARKPADEAPAADLAARLEPAVHAQQVAPRREQGLARHDPPEPDPVAAQQLPGDRFGELALRQYG